VTTTDNPGRQDTDFLWALRGIKSSSLVGLRAPSHPEMMGNTSYVIGDPDLPQLWQPIRDDAGDTYITAHLQLVHRLGVASPA
jgi:hypothetical protein